MEELESFLRQKGRTPETIQSILEGTSVSEVQRQALQRTGAELSLEEAERTASTWRQQFVESISVLEVEGAVWDQGNDSYLFRSEFPSEEGESPEASQQG